MLVQAVSFPTVNWSYSSFIKHKKQLCICIIKCDFIVWFTGLQPQLAGAATHTHTTTPTCLTIQSNGSILLMLMYKVQISFDKFTRRLYCKNSILFAKTNNYFDSINQCGFLIIYSLHIYRFLVLNYKTVLNFQENTTIVAKT